MTAIISSFVLIILGYEVSGKILGGGTIVSLAAAFIYGTWSRKNERIQKEEQVSKIEAQVLSNDQSVANR
jgi:hypothetical protein